ncbi:MAG TPA: YoaK family protein [Candidatus Binataceae bacterium]|nr:YoaK family protein [Candidatus Binataceae bacterium]
MRTAERDTLLVVLAITSGAADAWSYVGLGHAFVANMTGNTVLLGISVFNPEHDFLHPLIALACYATGVACGSFLTRRVRPGHIWSRSTSKVLLVEFLMLAGAELAWLAVGGTPSALLRCVILACVAIGIGLQSGALLPLKLPGIITTYITGTWTTLISGLALMLGSRERLPPNKENFEERLLIQIVFIGIYFLSAVTTVFVFQYRPTMTGAIPATPILLVAIYGLLRG